MAEYEFPEFTELTKKLNQGMREVLQDMDDLRAAMVSENPEAIMDEYESRRLLRKIPDTEKPN